MDLKNKEKISFEDMIEYMYNYLLEDHDCCSDIIPMCPSMKVKKDEDTQKQRQ